MHPAASSGPEHSGPAQAETAGDPPRQAGLQAAEVRSRLDFLAALGYGLLESGQTAGQTEQALGDVGRGLGLEKLVTSSFGRMLLLEASTAGGGTVSISGAARSLDAIDCTRSRELNRIAVATVQGVGRLQTAGDAQDYLAAALLDVQRLRDVATPWWVVTLGLTLLAFFISMQLGVTWQAWVSAALVQVLTSASGLAIGGLTLPKLFKVAVQSAVAGAFATVLVLLGFVDPVGAAVAIAVNWLLLLPLPQVVGAVTDAIEADYLSALSRLASVAVAAGGIFIGGNATFALGELLGMGHPRLDALPGLPWYFVLLFSALGAVSNAFANGGRLPLVRPAALLGLMTAAVNQFLLLVVGLSALWANSLSAVALGLLSSVMVARTGYPYQVLALMGITGALLPGIPVFFGILQEMGGGSGLEHFGTAAAISVGIGTGVALGVHLVRVVRKA